MKNLYYRPPARNPFWIPFSKFVNSLRVFNQPDGVLRLLIPVQVALCKPIDWAVYCPLAVAREGLDRKGCRLFRRRYSCGPTCRRRWLTCIFDRILRHGSYRRFLLYERIARSAPRGNRSRFFRKSKRGRTHSVPQAALARSSHQSSSSGMWSVRIDRRV